MRHLWWRWRWVLDIGLIAGGAWILALTASSVASHCLRPATAVRLRSVRPVPVATAAPPALSGIASRNLFAARVDVPEPPPSPDLDPDRPDGCDWGIAELSRCTHSLVGTVVGDPWAFAVMRHAGETQIVSTEPERNHIGDARVCDVDPSVVILRKGDTFERCELAAPAAVKASRIPVLTVVDAEGITRLIPRARVEWARNNLEKVAAGARFIPNRGGGFKVFSVKPGSFIAELGLHNGDVVEAIDGRPLSPDVLLEVYRDIGTTHRVSVALKRRGRPMTLDIAVAEAVGPQ